MEKIYILCIEDQSEVLHSVLEHLSFFEGHITIEECESTAEAKQLINEIDGEGDYVGVIVSDHAMPVQTGVEFLIELNNDFRFVDTKKILLTGQATHMDTIQAINQAAIDKYIEKPWKKEHLVELVSTMLTEFIIKKGIPYEPFLQVLDKPRLFELLK
ncbi:response regulator [Reichenbachiella versicolor]|uniref:response regulator n=1 Tax=Reichenbachiella versicolor TaxID=1821036 RepID=UPI000D6E7CB4|nr:response regulator [Reichenbachiella versicolor]